MFNLVTQLRQFKKRVISKKTPVLMLLNRQLPKGSGTIIDFAIDKQSKKIVIELLKEKELVTISVVNYMVAMIDNSTVVSWSHVNLKGAGHQSLKRKLNAQNKVVLPAYLFNLVSGYMQTMKPTQASV